MAGGGWLTVGRSVVLEFTLYFAEATDNCLPDGNNNNRGRDAEEEAILGGRWLNILLLGASVTKHDDLFRPETMRYKHIILP